jgi:hypothetical protein
VYKRRTKKQEESPVDRAARQTANATIWLAVFTVVLAVVSGLTLRILNGQLGEMQGSGKQTDKLICLYQKQVAQLEKQAGDTHNLAVRTKELAQTSRDALVEVQRAVMSADDLVMDRSAKDGKVNEFNFYIQWKNSGTTPTKNMTFHHSWMPSVVALPKDFKFTDLWAPNEPKINTPSFAGPQGRVRTTYTAIPPEIIKAVQEHKLRLYFWGWAKYRDVFKNTRPHISKYCTEVSDFKGDPFDMDSSHSVLMVTSNCETYNCHDDECKVN